MVYGVLKELGKVDARFLENVVKLARGAGTCFARFLAHAAVAGMSADLEATGPCSKVRVSISNLVHFLRVSLETFKPRSIAAIRLNLSIDGASQATA